MVVLQAQTGCGDDTLDWRNAQVSGGKTYSREDNKPFTGLVTNIPGQSIPTSATIEKTQQLQTDNAQRVGGRFQGPLRYSDQVCDMHVDAGSLIKGEAHRRSDAGAKFYDFALKNGELDGPFVVYDQSGKKVVMRANFSSEAASGPIPRSGFGGA